MKEPDCGLETLLHEKRDNAEENEADCAAEHPTTGHLPFSNLWNGTANVTTLEESADDTNEPNKCPILFVVPIKH